MEFQKKQKNILKKNEKLMELKRSYEEKIANLERKVNENMQNIYDNCISIFGQHKWIREVEDTMYGETFYVCLRCGCNY